MKVLMITLLFVLSIGAHAVSFEKCDYSDLNSGTLKDFYPLIEKLQNESPLRNKYNLFLRGAKIFNLDAVSEGQVMAELVAWPFNWSLDAEMVSIDKAPRKDNQYVLEQALLKDAFFVKKEFKNNLKNFAYLVELKMGRNDSIRLYEVSFSENIAATGFVIINSKSEEALLVLAIED